jgi:hypothetical protein
MTFTDTHRILLGAVMALSVSLAYAISSPNNPPDNDSPTAPAWKVVSAYGPRVADGSKFHKGIDYSPEPGNADKGTIIKSRTAGTIQYIGKDGKGIWYIAVSSPTGYFSYLHIFYDASTAVLTVANAKVKAAGYTKVQLGKVDVKPEEGGIRPCEAILFWKKFNGIEKIGKVLTTTQCPGVYTDPTGKKVTVKTSVAAEQDIAPLGTSYPPNGITAHLHLQVNAGNDNVLAWLDHDSGLISPGTEQFTAKLRRDQFDGEAIAAMAHPGFAIKVTENAKVPDLDKVIVTLDGSSTPIAKFSFGGREGQKRENALVDLGLNLGKGSSVPSIKPIDWGESGTPRAMWFFVPYPELQTLSPGEHTLNVIVKTVTGKSFPIPLTFTIKPGAVVLRNYGSDLTERIAQMVGQDKVILAELLQIPGCTESMTVGDCFAQYTGGATDAVINAPGDIIGEGIPVMRIAGGPQQGNLAKLILNAAGDVNIQGGFPWLRPGTGLAITAGGSVDAAADSITWNCNEDDPQCRAGNAVHSSVTISANGPIKFMADFGVDRGPPIDITCSGPGPLLC